MKFVTFSKNAVYSFQCRENNRNAVKIIVIDGKTEISTVEIDLRPVLTRVNMLTYNYHI